MKVKDFMTNNITFATTDSKVSDVAKLMQENHVGSIPICNHENKIVGMITDRDIVLRNVANKKDPNTTLASEIMTTDIVTVDPETDIYKVSRLMAERQIRRIPVVQNNKIVGLVTLGDLSKEKCFDMEIASCLCDICEPTKNS